MHQLFQAFRRLTRSRSSGRPARRPRRPLVERLEDRSLLAAVADLVAYRPSTEYIDYALHAVPAAVEEDPKLGPGIRINGDDDNGNAQRDYLDAATAAAGDNDLLRVDARASGTSFVVSWTGALAVWTSATKAAAVLNGSAVLANQPLWVEYVSQTHTAAANTTLTLTASDSTTGTTAVDSVVLHSFQSVVIAIGGNSQDPRNFGDPRLGVFTLGGTLYESGYDVHLYSHDQIQTNGRGAAYNEVVSAVLNRNADNVAIIGYSWGGGATYDLSAALYANSSLAPAGYRLQYTAYVDAIRHYSLSAETRKPVGTQSHDNFYQRRDWLLKGNSVAGANNINVTQTSWGQSLVHTTLDDNATLQILLVGNLKTRVLV